MPSERPVINAVLNVADQLAALAEATNGLLKQRDGERVARAIEIAASDLRTIGNTLDLEPEIVVVDGDQTS